MIKDNRTNVEYSKAISSVGFGWFHLKLILVCGWALLSDSIEVVCISFILPVATCQFKITTPQKGYLNGMIFAGLFFGGLIWGTLSDIFGRKKILIISFSINSFGAISSTFCQEYGSFMFFRFISGFGIGGALPVIFIYFTEFLPTNKRGKLISVLATCWMVGNSIAAALAWLIIPLNITHKFPSFTYSSWQIYLLICALPSLTSFLLFLLMPESPKFLIEIADDKNALRVFRIMYHANHMKPKFPIKSLKIDNEPRKLNYRNTIIDSFKQFFVKNIELWRKKHVRTTVLMTYIFCGFSFGYYGLFMWFPELFHRIQKFGGSVCSVGIENKSMENNNFTFCEKVDSEIYWEGLLTGFSNLPGNLFTIFLIDKFGRKYLLASSMIVSGLAAFFILFMKTRLDNILLSCFFSAISVIGWNAMDVLYPELYPTHLRSTAMGSQSAFGRLAALLGNICFGKLIDTHCMYPLIIIFVLFVTGGLSALLLPNTRHIDLQ